MATSFFFRSVYAISVLVLLLLTHGFVAARAERCTAGAGSSERVQAAGGLDPVFGDGGLITTSFFGNGDGAASVAIQSDGKIVAAGYASHGNDPNTDDFAVSRYNPDGEKVRK